MSIWQQIFNKNPTPLHKKPARTWLARARQWLSEFAERVQNTVSSPSTASIQEPPPIYEEPTTHSTPFESSPDPHAVMFTTTFLFLGHFAKCDGRVSEQEIALAEAIMMHWPLNPSQRQEAITLFQQGKRGDFNIDSTLTTFYKHCKIYKRLIRRFIEMQLRMAYADGLPSPAARVLLAHLCQQLDFSPTRFEALEAFIRRHQTPYRVEPKIPKNHQTAKRRATFNPAILEAYNLLGVEIDANEEQIRLAYRRLLSQYHPDKLVSRSASPEQLQQATEKTRQIKTAYDRIKAAHTPSS